MVEDPDARRQGALFGWSPPRLPADTRLKRLVDRLLPATGIPLVAFYGAVVAVLLLAPLAPRRGELALDGVAALAAGGWCALNFWRCRHAHCLVTAAGWLALAALAFAETGLGHSVIGGDEQLVFIAVLAAALVFEATWARSHASNAVPLRR